MATPNLSKSRYMSGRQCHLRLWNEIHIREAASEPDEVTQHIFDVGTLVGELARRRFSPGVLVDDDHRNFKPARRKTLDLLKDSKVRYIYEGAFIYRHVRIRADILERLPDGTWRLIEVKAVGAPKPNHLEDLAVQLWVLKRSGLEVAEAGVLTLNKAYIRGKSLNLRKLFKYHSLINESKEVFPFITREIKSMKEMLATEQSPDILPGEHCNSPYTCPYIDHCTEGMVYPEHPISELPHSHNVAIKLRNIGVEQITEIPDDFPLSAFHERIRQSILSDRQYVSDSLSEVLSGLKKPIRHLDFETVAFAVPRYEGTKPFESLPFMFSVHTEQPDGSPKHRGYLSTADHDPRRDVAEKLLEFLGKRGSICVYSHYEATHIGKLMDRFPDLRTALGTIRDRIVDLLPIVRTNYYHPDFHGSFSLKSVYPVLGKGDYTDLSISEGSLAAVKYVQAIDSPDEKLRSTIFSELVEYCKRDTLATVEVKETLDKLA